MTSLSQSSFFGAIADDFTGASDLAALLARSGVEVRLRLGVPTAPPKQTASFEIIALKSRTCPADEAVTESLAALEWLKAAGAQRFFFKYCSTFDSTSKGNIGPVSEALMQALGADQTIYCPAFPENGRTIFMGNLFVGQQPLSESPMKDHPLTPMKDSNLVRLLDAQTKMATGLVDRLVVARGAAALSDHLEALKTSGVAHVITDAVADSDLEIITQSCWNMPLITGGSALAMSLPRHYQQAGYITQTAHDSAIPELSPSALILSGSCSEMTRRQVSTYTGPSYKLDALEIAHKGLDAARTWLSEQDLSNAPLIYATSSPEEVKQIQQKLGAEAAGELIEQALSSLAIQGFEMGVRRFVIAGGETSGAVAKALDIDNLLIGAEIAAGVPWCFARTETDPFAITLKSGNFGGVEFFSDALDMLK